MANCKCWLISANDRRYTKDIHVKSLTCCLFMLQHLLESLLICPALIKIPAAFTVHFSEVQRNHFEWLIESLDDDDCIDDYRSSLHAGEETCRCGEPVPWFLERGAAFPRFLAAPFLLCSWAKPRWKDGVPLRSDPTQISAWQRPRGLLAKTKLWPAERIPPLKAAACS